MRILQISSKDFEGGAAVAAYTINRGLNEIGVESIYMAGERTLPNQKTHELYGRKFRKILGFVDALAVMKYQNRTKKYPFSNNWFSTFTCQRKVVELKPDLVHLHWIGKGLLGMRELAKIKIPIVWTLHDSFPFTGGCHLPNDCTNFYSRCGMCPQLASHRGVDQSTYNFISKQKTYSRKTMHFIAPSRWMLDRAKNSVLLRDTSIHHIPNAIDIQTYYPESVESARKELMLPANGKIIVFGAMNSTSDPNKGYLELRAALELLKPELNITVVVFGSNSPPEISDSHKIRTIGYVSDVNQKRKLFSAANAVIVPSKIENLSNVILESLACGTPVVAFETGGNSDAINHLSTGYLAKCFSKEDLARGILWALERAKQDDQITNCADSVRLRFEMRRIAASHKQLYTRILNEQ